MATRLRRESQRSRVPAGAVFCGRPSRWGNPFRIVDTRAHERDAARIPERFMVVCDLPGVAVRITGLQEGEARAWVVALHRLWLLNTASGQRVCRQACEELAGRDLACYCEIGEPCHVDTLLAVVEAGKVAVGG